MAELFNVRCAQGRLIITDQAIIIELGKGGSIRQQTLAKSACTGVESKRTMMPFFGLTKGASTLIFHGQGLERLQADMVETPTANAIVALLQGRS